MTNALGWTLLAALGYVVGGCVVWFKKDWSARSLSLLVSVSTGLLLSVAVGGMIPHALSENPAQAPWILVGMLTAFGFQRWHTHRKKTDEKKVVIWSACSGMGIHSFFEGMAMGAGFHAGPQFGFSVLLAILLHKIPEGLAISTLAMSGFQERKKATASVLILALATILGTGTAVWIAKLSWMHAEWSAIALLFSAGVLLYIAGTELWPVVNRAKYPGSAFCLLLTVFFYYLLGWTGSLLSPGDHHSGQTAQNHSSHTDGHHHASVPVEIPEGTPVPAVRLHVSKDSESGWNLHVQTEHFRFAPEAVNQPGRMGDGHAHLFVDGKKWARLYGPWYHLGKLPPGTHQIRVQLNSNQHAPLVYKGKTIEDSVMIEEEK
ncbi:ZIP family metal transporter [Lihuaxuella thermophila]|uniref:Zinc transporter ZupT n=1 Tax=Lihuaxuella thermophila TaxID=1173111 RepID=A0A1H8EPY2_9BACL|nr:ZIP family metal transporter [Lihuaxuella thermophila]SEN21456.1 Zinc transporter ZupT [Lihuaxuella thermophila]